MSVSDQELLHHLARLPFIDAGELALILGEPLATVHRALTGLLKDGTAGRVSHGTAHLPSSHRYYLTKKGIAEATDALGYDAPSDFVRDYPVSRQWLALLVRRMDVVASVYRLAATLSPGVDGLESRVEFQRRGRFDAVTTLHNGRSFGVVRQGLALRRRSLYDRLRAIAEYHPRAAPPWCWSWRPAPGSSGSPTSSAGTGNSGTAMWAWSAWRPSNSGTAGPGYRPTGWLAGGTAPWSRWSPRPTPGGRFSWETPERKRASLPDPARMVRSAPAFGLTPSEKRALDLITAHPMIPREHLARWLGVSDGRLSQIARSLTQTWGLVEQHGKRDDVRYAMSDWGIRYITRRDRAQLSTTIAAWSTEDATDNHGQPRPLGHRILTWQRQTGHADGITWFLSELATEARTEDASELRWSIPTAPSDRAFNRGEDAIAPDAVGHLLAGGLHLPFYFEHELRARHPKGVLARLRAYTHYYHSNAPGEDMAPFPVTLFVVDNEEVEETYARTAALMNLMTLPILVSSADTLTRRGLLGRSWRPLWETRPTRLVLSGLTAYQWDSMRHRMHPIGSDT